MRPRINVVEVDTLGPDTCTRRVKSQRVKCQSQLCQVATSTQHYYKADIRVTFEHIPSVGNLWQGSISLELDNGE